MEEDTLICRGAPAPPPAPPIQTPTSKIQNRRLDHFTRTRGWHLPSHASRPSTHPSETVQSRGRWPVRRWPQAGTALAGRRSNHSHSIHTERRNYEEYVLELSQVVRAGHPRIGGAQRVG